MELLETPVFSTARCPSSHNSLRGIHSITHHPVHILVAVLPPALMVFFLLCTHTAIVFFWLTLCKCKSYDTTARVSKSTFQKFKVLGRYIVHPVHDFPKQSKTVLMASQFLFFSSSLAHLEPELELFEVWEINVRQIIIIANGINSQTPKLQRALARVLDELERN